MIFVLLLIIALLISIIAKKVSDNQVSEPKQEKTTETKKENKKQQTNLPKVKKINQSGEKNSQFGTIWVNNGLNIMKIKKTEYENYEKFLLLC